LVLCRFFHANCQFFEFFSETWKQRGSFHSEIFIKINWNYWRLCEILKILKKTKTGDSWIFEILKKISKPEFIFTKSKIHTTV
jgi:hypothetical protein